MAEKLSIKQQLRLIRDKCPDVWDEIIESCPSSFGLEDKIDCTFHEDCPKCWDLAMAEDNDYEI